MASGRLLNSTLLRNAKLLALFVISGIVILSCGTTKSSQRDSDSGPAPSDDSEQMDQNEISDDFLVAMNDNRSSLRDAYAGFSNSIPAVFRQESEARDIGDPNEGYRIQIFSTRNVDDADEMANNFQTWARQHLTEYIPKVYVLFRQPYYKVHVGNFQFHDQAMKLNKILKSDFPDAWVVHDEVEPDLVPADSLNFQENESHL